VKRKSVSCPTKKPSAWWPPSRRRRISRIPTTVCSWCTITRTGKSAGSTTRRPCDAGVSKNDEASKAAVTEYVMRHIPDWARDL
jgi:hypothetical protein